MINIPIKLPYMLIKGNTQGLSGGMDDSVSFANKNVSLQELADQVLQVMPQFFRSLAYLDLIQAASRLQPGKPRQHLQAIDNLLSPFLLLASAEKVHHLSKDQVDASCSTPLPMYEEVVKDLLIILQLFKLDSSKNLFFTKLLDYLVYLIRMRISLCRFYLHLCFLTSVHHGNVDFAILDEVAKSLHSDPNSEGFSGSSRLREGNKASCECPLMFSITSAIDAWKETLFVEVDASLSAYWALRSLNQVNCLATMVNLSKLKNNLVQWEGLLSCSAAWFHSQPPASSSGVEDSVARNHPRYRYLLAVYRHLVSKLPLYFHFWAGRVMDMNVYYESILLSCPRLSYVRVVADFLQSYGPQAQVSVTILVEMGDEEAYALPSRAVPKERSLHPVFSMTAAQAVGLLGGTGLDSSQHSRGLGGGGINNRQPSPKTGAHHKAGPGPASWFWLHFPHMARVIKDPHNVGRHSCQQYPLGGGVGSDDSTSTCSWQPQDSYYLYLCSPSAGGSSSSNFSFYIVLISNSHSLVLLFNEGVRSPTDQQVRLFLSSLGLLLRDKFVFKESITSPRT